jgi:hypothetical protein
VEPVHHPTFLDFGNSILFQPKMI